MSVVAEFVSSESESWSHQGVHVLAGKFLLDSELSLPAWYSSTTLVVSALLLGLIAWHKRGEPFALHWAGLSAVFVGMSFDELSGMHELLIVPLRRYVGAAEVFRYAWVVPGMCFVAGIAIAYYRFVFSHLGPRSRRGFILSGLLYVSGALGLELVEGVIDSRFGVGSLPAICAVTIEESLEMIAIVWFIRALCRYIADEIGSVRVVVDSAGPRELLVTTAPALLRDRRSEPDRAATESTLGAGAR